MVSPLSPLGLCSALLLCVSVSETYFSVCVFQISDIVPGDQILHPSLHLVFVFVPSLYVRISMCLTTPRTSVHTEELQEEQDAEQSSCHPAVWSSGLF